MNTNKVTIIGSIIIIFLIIAIPTIYKVIMLIYLEEVSNPITKEYYNNSSFVEVAGNDFKFVIVEWHF